MKAIRSDTHNDSQVGLDKWRRLVNKIHKYIQEVGYDNYVCIS